MSRHQFGEAVRALLGGAQLAGGFIGLALARQAQCLGGRLPGGTIVFPVVSVGATENALMAAVRAKGTCILENAAREPEIVDLCNLLVAMGAHIEGIGTEKLIVEGVDRLHGATYAVMPDRIEAGSYACAVGLAGGTVELDGANPDDMQALAMAATPLCSRPR